VRFDRVLFRLHDQPTIIVRQLTQHRGEVNIAVTRNGEHAGDDGIEEAPVAITGLLHDRLAHVLAVDMCDAGAVSPGEADRIDASEGGVARVEQQLYRRSGGRHEAVDVGAGLYDRAHVVMVGESDALRGDGVGQFRQPGGERQPRGIRHDRPAR